MDAGPGFGFRRFPIAKGTLSQDCISSSLAFAIDRGSCGSSPRIVSEAYPLFQYAIFPFSFRRQVSWMTQELPLKFFLAAPGIPYRVTRRTTLPLVSGVAHTASNHHVTPA